MFYILSLCIFLFCFGGNIPLALISWLFFIAFVKPGDWHI